MKYNQIVRRWLPAVLAVTMYIPGLSYAQGLEFADDFSSDSVRFSAGSFNGPDGNYSVTPTANGLQLSTIAETADQPASVYLTAIDDSDSFGMDFSHASSSNVDGGFGTAFLEATLYSDIADSASRNGEGTVEAQMTFGYGPDRQLSVWHCLERRDANGDLLDVQGTCGQFEGLALNFDQRYALNVSIDRDAKQITFSVDDVTKTIGVPETLYQPSENYRRIQLYLSDGSGSASGTLQAIRFGEESIDMAANPPIFDRYQTNFEPGSAVAITDEKLAITTVSVAEDGRWTDAELYLQQPTDYIEAEFFLSSESDVSMPNYRVFAGLDSIFYNTQTDGGTDGRLGDVRANLSLEVGGDGLRRAEICLQRFDDAEGNVRTGLLDPENAGNRCDNLPLRIEFDKVYRASMSLDRSASTMTFRLNGMISVVSLESDFFRAADPYSKISIASTDDGIAVGTIDNIRTAPDALTTSEQSSGATAPVPFPDPVDPAAIQEDSTITYPVDFFDYQPRLDFVDDFNGVTSDFGFWSGRDRGGSGVSWSDGAITLETSTADGNDDGNWTEFYLNSTTDLLEAVVSLSSETRIEPGNTGAEIGIRAIFYNDTQDYGFNDQEGDMEASLRLQFEGDGRRRLRVQLRRRDSGGSGGDSILDDIVEFENGLMALIPELDQQYRLSLAINRDSGSIRFGVDDQFTDYQISSGVFLPSRNRVLVSVNHYRSSGVAVGRIHSIKTDTIDEDFTLEAPVFAPYQPLWNAQYAGRSVENIDGRLRLEADGALTSERDPGIAAIGASDYVSATIELSSESVVLADGRVHVELHGILYNDLADGQQADSSEGRVFSAVRLTADGNGERFVQHCAYRSNDASFEESTELFGGDEDNCPRFNFIPEFDTPYDAFVKLDREAATLTYGFNGETVVYDIQTSISNAQPFSGARARTTDNSKVVAWVDDLAFAEIPVALADSASLLVQDVGSSSNGSSGDGSTTDSSGSGDSDQAASSSGGGVAGPGMLLLLLLLGTVRARCKAGSQWLAAMLATRPMRTVCICTGLALMVGCATSSVTVPSQLTSTNLSSSEVLAHISGKTETWSSGAAYYAADGSIEVVWKGKSSTGTWLVGDDGNVCFFASVLSPDEECHRYRLKDGVVHLVYNDYLSQRDVIEGNQLDNFR